MTELDYIVDVGQHILTCTHPHYTAIYENSPYQFNFKYPSSIEHSKYKEYLDNFIDDAQRLGCSNENIQFFIKSIHPNCKNYQLNNIGFVPTHPFFGPDKYIVNLEHYSSLFTYLYINANKDTSEVDMYESPWSKLMTAALMQNSFCAILTHMHDTINTFKILLRENTFLHKKLIYFPLASPEAHQDKQPKKIKDRVNVLFTNSFGGQLSNFRLRGGVESFNAIMSLIMDEFPQLYFITVGPTPLFNHPRVKQFPNHIENNLFQQIIDESHILLIPAMRIHTISLVKAMCNGIVPIVSDGWGFDEYIHDEYNGLICRGQNNFTTKKDHNNILIEAYGNSASSHLINDIISSLKFIIKNPDIYEMMSLNCITYAKENFNIDRRNKILEKVVKNAV